MKTFSNRYITWGVHYNYGIRPIIIALIATNEIWGVWINVINEDWNIHVWLKEFGHPCEKWNKGTRTQKQSIQYKLHKCKNIWKQNIKVI